MMRALLVLSLVACKQLSVAESHISARVVVPLHSFSMADGVHPRASMVLGPDGALYGTTWTGGTANCGTVYRFDPTTAAYAVIHDFSGLDATGRNADGCHSIAPASFGPDGRLYVTAREGGTGGSAVRPSVGVLASMLPDGSDYKTHHMFASVPKVGGWVDGYTPQGGLVWIGAAAYGASTGGIYKWDGSIATVIHAFAPLLADRTNVGGAVPYGSPVAGPDGKLYGWTTYGGHNAGGVVYSLDPTSGAYATLYDLPAYTFLGNGDNAPLQSPLVASDGAIYLATEFGGVNGTGLLLKIERTATVLHEFTVYSATIVPRFSSADGLLPLGTLVEGVDGMLYGTTYYGGSAGYGSVFRVGKDGRGFEQIYSATGITHDPSAVCYPSTGLTRGRDDKLYGATFLCGAIGGGLIYRMD